MHYSVLHLLINPSYDLDNVLNINMTGKALTLNMSNTLFKQIRLHYIKYFVLLSGTNIYPFLNQDKFTGHANDKRY